MSSAWTASCKDYKTLSLFQHKLITRSSFYVQIVSLSNMHLFNSKPMLNTKISNENTVKHLLAQFHSCNNPFTHLPLDVKLPYTLKDYHNKRSKEAEQFAILPRPQWLVAFLSSVAAFQMGAALSISTIFVREPRETWRLVQSLLP